MCCFVLLRGASCLEQEYQHGSVESCDQCVISLLLQSSSFHSLLDSLCKTQCNLRVNCLSAAGDAKLFA